MKLSSILAAISLLAAPGLAAAQAHGGPGMAGGAGHGASVVRSAGSHPGAGGGFHGGRFDHHPDFHDRFHHRGILVGAYPYWGWSDCAFDVDCGWSGADGLTPADYADPPAPPPGYAPAASPHRAEVNECSDWVWNARQHRSVCKRPFRG